MTILPIHLPYQIFKLIANFASLSSHQINDLRVIREEQATVQRWTSFVAILQPQVLPDRAWTALTGTCSHASLETHDITQLTYITIIICYFLQYAVTLTTTATTAAATTTTTTAMLLLLLLLTIA